MDHNISNSPYAELISKSLNVANNNETSLVEGKVVGIENAVEV
jgi:hypothetical protein